MADKELVQYFIDQTNERFDKIETKLDTLLAFRWLLVGGSIAVSSILTIIFNALFLFFGGK